MPDESMRQSPTDIPYLSQKDITLADIMRELKELKDEVRELSVAVTGNGNPMAGMVVRVTLLERWRTMSDRRALGHTIGTALNFILGVAVAIYFFLQVNQPK